MYPPFNAPTLNSRLEAIRKTTVAFAALFKDIPFVKYDNVSGAELERIKVPIIYGDKEKYVKRLDIPEEKVQITLPRIEYGLINMQYDASRRMNQANKMVGCSSDGTSYVSSPMPYNFNFELVLYTRNIEDANQIMEYILPHFYPDYNLKINFVPEVGITKNVPITFTGESEDEDSQGVFDSAVRSVFRTLQFTARSYIFQPPKYYKPILWANTNINLLQPTISITLSSNTFGEYGILSNTGDPIITQGGLNILLTQPNGVFHVNDIVFQGSSYDRATAKATIVSWNPDTLTMSAHQTYGTFSANSILRNVGSSAKFLISNITDYKTVYTTTATSSSPYIYPPIEPYDYNIIITDNTL